MRLYISPIKALYREMRKNGSAEFTSVAVCCSSYPIDRDRLPNIPLLCLQFDDIQNEHSNRTFTVQIAKEIGAFVAQHQDCDLYFCCDSGESRSAALAAAFARFYRLDEMSIWKDPHYHPNPLVYRLQCQALDMRLSKLGLRMRMHRNKRAFRVAIRNAR